MIRISTGMQQIPLGVNGLNDVFNGGALDFYSGGQPADPNDAPSGTLVASLPFEADAFSAPLAGDIGLLGVPIEAMAVAADTIGWARIRTLADSGASSATDPRIDGEVTVPGGGGDFQGAPITVGIGDPVRLIGLTIRWPRGV